MEYVILGLLIIKNSTLYDLNKDFERSISLFYSSSYGSLQMALKSLIRKKYVCYIEINEGGRSKKIYEITKDGRDSFYNWMLSKIPINNKMEIIILSKINFLGLIKDSKTRLIILDNMYKAIDQSLTGLIKLDVSLSNHKVDQSYKEIFSYQLKTLDYGIGSHEFAKSWIERLIIDEKK